MAIGDWHELNGYWFRETLHGPFVAAECVDCAGECYVVQPTGRAEDVSTVEPRCASCGRTRWGAPVKIYADKPRVQHGIGFPGHLDADRLTRLAEVAPGRIVERGREVFADGPDVLPPAAVALCRRVDGRMLLSRARRADSPRTAAGKPSAGWDQVDTWLSVQWRPEGKPPTIMAFWRNGKRDRAMIAGVEMSHTAAGAR